MNFPVRHAVVGLLFVGLALSACGPAEDSPEAREKQLEAYAKQHGLDVDVSVGEDGEALAITQQVGGHSVTTGKDLARPEQFPDDVILYPNMRILAVSEAPTGPILQGQSDDEAAQVATYLREQMPSQGWTDQSPPAAAAAPLTSLRFVKDDRSVNVNLIRTGEQTQIQIALLPAG